MKNTLILIIILFSQSSFSQDQLGQDLNGEQKDEMAGHTIALSGDGNRIAIGSPGFEYEDGRVRIYEWDDDQWVQLGNDITGFYSQSLGQSVSLSGDGNRLAVVAKDNFALFNDSLGEVSIHEWDGENWMAIKKILEVDSYDYFEKIRVSLSAEGNHLIISKKMGSGFERDGLVKVYEQTENDWIQRGETLNGFEEFNDFGASIDISADGNQILIGDPLADFGSSDDVGTIRAYRWQDSVWVQKGQTIRGSSTDSEIGAFSAFSSDGNYLIYSERVIDFFNNYFVVKVMKWNGVSWIKHGEDFEPFTRPQSIIGNHMRLDISADGNVISLADSEQNTSGPQKGHIAIYKKLGNQWVQIGEQLSGISDRDHWGTQLALSNDGKRLAVGSHFVSLYGDNSGLVRVYSLESITSVKNTPNNRINFYPNPTSGIVDLGDTNIAKIIAFNRFGQIVKTILAPSENIDISDLKNGIYILQVHSSTKIYSRKVIKQ